ncbi:MAG TPA: glycosyltransferase family 2 protein [Patescibacteria group bacterium]|nr:glycosyltransferase family 2 protein [Patescibacteria group bacterium]
MADISVVIVSFNTKKVLTDCLLSLRKTKDVGIEVFVVDNASSDGTVELLQKEFPEVKLIDLPDNKGFAAANNIALRQVATRYVVLLNPDTEVMPETFSIMMNYMGKYPRVGVSTCRVELASGGLDKDCRRSFPTPWVAFTHFSGLSKLFPKSKLFGKYQMTYLPDTEIHEVESVVGAFMFIRREAMDEVGFLDETFFFYGEDIDWCYRFREKGWLVTYNPYTRIIHYKGYSSGLKKHSKHLSTATIESKKKVTKARFDAMKIFYKKHYRHTYPSVVTSLVLLAVDVKRLAALLSIMMEERKK